jgi:hypothetical protein
MSPRLNCPCHAFLLTRTGHSPPAAILGREGVIRRRLTGSSQRPPAPASSVRNSLDAIPIARRCCALPLQDRFLSANEQFSRSSATLDADRRRSHVGVGPLLAGTDCYSRALESFGMVCDDARAISTDRGDHSVQAGAHDGQPAQARGDDRARHFRRICLDTQSHVPRTVNSASRLGRQARHFDAICGTASFHPPDSVCTNSSRGAHPSNSIRQGLRSILPSREPLARAAAALIDGNRAHPIVRSGRNCRMAAPAEYLAAIWS